MCKAVPETSYERASEVAAALAIASAGPEKIFPRFAARWVTRTNAWCAETYQEWGEHPIGSWRRRLRDLGAWALDRIPPEETTLGGLPPVVSSIEVAYPQSADVRVVERLLRDGLPGPFPGNDAAGLARHRHHRAAADHEPAASIAHAATRALTVKELPRPLCNQRIPGQQHHDNKARGHRQHQLHGGCLGGRARPLP